MNITKVLSHNHPDVKEYRNAGLYPMVVSINGYVCMAYLIDAKGLVWGQETIPTINDKPKMSIQSASLLPLTTLLLTYDNIETLKN